MYDNPRKPIVIEGVSLLTILVSEITITSAFNFSLLFITNFSKLSEPHSSSPSIINFILKLTSSNALSVSYAFKCIYICPLSSHAPLA